MNGYEVEINQLRRAAAAAQSCADQLAQADVAVTVREVPAALPGSQSGPQLIKLAGLWRATLSDSSRAWHGHSTSLTQSADQYTANDSAAAEVFTPAGHRQREY